jgi:hypothetical protein
MRELVACSKSKVIDGSYALCIVIYLISRKEI